MSKPITITVGNDAHTIREWAAISKIGISTIKARLKYGWNPQLAVTLGALGYNERRSSKGGQKAAIVEISKNSAKKKPVIVRMGRKGCTRNNARHYGLTVEEYQKRLAAGLLPCRICKEWLPKEKFYVNPCMPRGYSYECQDCNRKANRKKDSTRKIIPENIKQEIKANAENLTGKELAKKYGISDTAVYRILDTGKTKKVRERNAHIRDEYGAFSIKQLSEIYGLSVEHIKRILEAEP